MVKTQCHGNPLTPPTRRRFPARLMLTQHKLQSQVFKSNIKMGKAAAAVSEAGTTWVEFMALRVTSQQLWRPPQCLNNSAISGKWEKTTVAMMSAEQKCLL